MMKIRQSCSLAEAIYTSTTFFTPVISVPERNYTRSQEKVASGLSVL